MKRRTARVPFYRSLLAFRLVLGVIFVLSAWGFIINTRMTLHLQAQLAPGMEHPYDYYATGCLLVGLLCVMFYYLTRAERVQPRIWTRVRSPRAWASARPGQTRSRRILHVRKFRRRRQLARFHRR